jgi:hypothetical protein
LSLAGDILRNKAMEAVVTAARAVDSEGNPVELPRLESMIEPSDEFEDDEGFEADLVEGETLEAQLEAHIEEAHVYEAEVLDEEDWK